MPAMKSIGPFEHIVLEAVAALGEETYGTRVLDRACTLAGDDVNVGSVYVTLERLRKKGFLKTVAAKPTGRPGWQPTKIYKLSPFGEAALDESVQTTERLFMSYLSRKRERIPDLRYKLKLLHKQRI
jgi:DNA-binding PadR family transcriptional regulator